jgi:hypothetical protein
MELQQVDDRGMDALSDAYCELGDPFRVERVRFGVTRRAIRRDMDADDFGGDSCDRDGCRPRDLHRGEPRGRVALARQFTASCCRGDGVVRAAARPLRARLQQRVDRWPYPSSSSPARTGSSTAAGSPTCSRSAPATGSSYGHRRRPSRTTRPSSSSRSSHTRSPRKRITKAAG